MNRLQEKYKTIIVDKIKKEFNYSTVMQVPKVEKIIINCGIGDSINNQKLIAQTVDEIQDITGQKPVITKAKKSIASFKLREGMPIGVKVTLRDKKMYDFLDKLISISLPRVRDFQGVSKKSFDGKGNYTLGIKEQIIFPEIDFDKIMKIRGLELTIVTTAKNDKEGYVLLKELGMPFKNIKNKNS